MQSDLAYTDPVLGLQREPYVRGQRRATLVSREFEIAMKIAAERARDARVDVDIVSAIDAKREKLLGKGIPKDVIDAGLARARGDAKWREKLVSHPSRATS
jgi:hypothetical protein